MYVLLSFIPSIRQSTNILHHLDAQGTAPELVTLRYIWESLIDPNPDSNTPIVNSESIQYWQTRGERITIRYFPDTGFHSERACYFAAMGFLAFMHIHNHSLGPEPLSPFLLQLILNGWGCFSIDEKLASHVDADISQILQPWTRCSRQGPITTTSELGSLLAQNDIEVCLSDSLCTAWRTLTDMLQAFPIQG